jgi:hypothetical protein
MALTLIKETTSPEAIISVLPYPHFCRMWNEWNWDHNAACEPLVDTTLDEKRASSLPSSERNPLLGYCRAVANFYSNRRLAHVCENGNVTVCFYFFVLPVLQRRYSKSHFIEEGRHSCQSNPRTKSHLETNLLSSKIILQQRMEWRSMFWKLVRWRWSFVCQVFMSQSSSVLG